VRGCSFVTALYKGEFASLFGIDMSNCQMALVSLSLKSNLLAPSCTERSLDLTNSTGGCEAEIKLHHRSTNCLSSGLVHSKGGWSGFHCSETPTTFNWVGGPELYLMNIVLEEGLNLLKKSPTSWTLPRPRLEVMEKVHVVKK
jgi:hypothetical protein